MVGLLQVKLYEPVLLVSVKVGIVIPNIVKLALATQPPAAVTVTLVTPGLRPEPKVWLGAIVAGGGLHITA